LVARFESQVTPPATITLLDAVLRDLCGRSRTTFC